LEEEISMLNTYCELESLRFADRFNYDINVDDEIIASNIMIPSMLIQPFVENAIIHGMKGNKDGFIQIQFKGGQSHIPVTILDNGKGFDSSKINIQKSLGMSITQKRLKFLTSSVGSEYDISVNSTEKGTSIHLNIPIQQNS